MTAYWVAEHLFWAFVIKGDHLHCDFGIKISRNIFVHKWDTLRDYFNPHFRSPGPFVSDLQGIEELYAGFQRAIIPKFWKKKFLGTSLIAKRIL